MVVFYNKMVKIENDPERKNLDNLFF